MRHRALKILVTAAVLLGGVGLLVFASLRDAEYYKMVDEVMVKPADWVGKSMQIHGNVEPGSIDEKIVGQRTTRTFVLEKNGQRILVRHHGPKPDSFRDMAEIVAKGKLVEESGGYAFEATQLTAKCPSKYEGAEDPHREDGSIAKPVF